MAALDVFLLFIRDSRILVALRENTGYADGQWNVPSGKVEPGEELLAAAVREAREEVAVEVTAARLATVVHVHPPGGPRGSASSSKSSRGKATRRTRNPTSAAACGGCHWTRCRTTRSRTPRRE